MKDNKHIQSFNEHQENLNISDVSDSVSIIDEGNINYHIERGSIEHFYFVDENKEFATCQCGRVLRKHYH